MRIILNMNLAELPVGAMAQIATFSKELQDSFRQRLRELGFREGQCVSCVRQTPFGGPKIFMVGGAVFSLAADVAAEVHTAPHTAETL